MMRKRIALGIFLLSLAVLPVRAGEGPHWVFPSIDGYGKVAPMPGAALQPDKGVRYRLALDATARSKQPDEVNPALDKVARTLNAFAAGGVRPQAMSVVVVLHGEATWAAVEGPHYRTKHGRGNPNLPLLRTLHQEGVRLLVCGQALAHRGIDPHHVAAPVTTALAATVALADLQRRGYQVLCM